MKLSKTQIRLLTIMRDENTPVVTMNSRDGTHVFIYNSIETPRWLRYKTVFILADLGLIENITDPGWRWRDSEYRITQAGLDAINGK